MAKHEPDIFFLDKAVMVKIIDIKGELNFGLQIGVVNPEKAVNEFLKVDVIILVDVHHGEKPFTYYSWNRSVLQDRYFVYSLRSLI